ncbi:MAG: hypothetical protein OHK0015_06640 [Chloroflexi bacterium OHK40]
MQLEAEVARLERVRGVWLDTRRNLQLERHFTEEEIRRVEGRRAQWERAEALVVAHPHEPFCAEVAATIGAEPGQTMTARAEAGSAVRRLVHGYQSAAAFQRQRLRGVVARYRGLDLVVQAHAVFAADLSLALPGGATLDTVNASTDTGVWQSVGHTVSDIPSILERLHRRIAEAHERIATIDRELVRLEEWDGQATYDAAMGELQAINAAFAAAEAQADPESGGAHATGPEGAAQPARATAEDEPSLADLLLTLAQQERAEEGWNEWATIIPPAPASLTWMAAEVERQAVRTPLLAEPLVGALPEAEAAPRLAAEVGRCRTPSTGRAQFGDVPTQRRAVKPPVPAAPADEVEVSQLSLF